MVENALTVPKSVRKRLTKNVRQETYGAVPDSCQELINRLGTSNDFEYEVFNSVINQTTVVSAIIFHDKRTAPPEKFDITILEGDVTFGLSGPPFAKWSLVNAVTIDRQVRLILHMNSDTFATGVSYSICAAGITNEDTPTFRFECDFILNLYPILSTKVFIYLVDGDKAKWSAAREKFQRVKIILCLYHATENVNKRLGPLTRKTTNATVKDASGVEIIPDEDLSTWISCDSCEKWRLLPSGEDIPLSFKCSDNAWSDHEGSCSDACDYETYANTIHI
jgi:hypothetical protein